MFKRFWWTKGVWAMAGATLLIVSQASEAQRGGSDSNSAGSGTVGWPGAWGYGFGGDAYDRATLPSTGIGGYSYPDYTGPTSPPPDYTSIVNYPTDKPDVYFPNALPKIVWDEFPDYPAAVGTATDPNAVYLRVIVPRADARLVFDGHLTHQQGYARNFVTQMAPGTTGVYHVKVRWREKGRVHEETRNVHVYPGLSEVVDFNQSLGTVRILPRNRHMTAEENPHP